MNEDDINQKNKTKRLLLIGNLGHGKSTTGNFLLKRSFFTRGDISDRVTNDIKTCTSNGYTITDTPGFGDLNDKHLFYTKMIEFKKHVLEQSPFDALILVVKFDFWSVEAEIDSASFNKSIDNFEEAFGPEGFKSLILICIQNKLHHNETDFDLKLKSSEGFKKLKKLNSNFDIPYVLWDNFEPEPDQLDRLDHCLHYNVKFTRNSMEHAIVLIGRFLKYNKNSNVQIQEFNVGSLDSIYYFLGKITFYLLIIAFLILILYFSGQKQRR